MVAFAGSGVDFGGDELQIAWPVIMQQSRPTGTDVGNKVSPNAAAQLLGHSSDAVTRKHYMDKSKAVRAIPRNTFVHSTRRQKTRPNRARGASPRLWARALPSL